MLALVELIFPNFLLSFLKATSINENNLPLLCLQTSGSPNALNILKATQKEQQPNMQIKLKLTLRKGEINKQTKPPQLISPQRGEIKGDLTVGGIWTLVNSFSEWDLFHDISTDSHNVWERELFPNHSLTEKCLESFPFPIFWMLLMINIKKRSLGSYWCHLHCSKVSTGQIGHMAAAGLEPSN